MPMRRAAAVTTRWHVYASAEALADRAAQVVIRCASEATAQRGAFSLVLAGGSTPRAVYERLRRLPADWRRWEVWFGDERCLPDGDAQRNDVMAHDALLAHVPIPAQRVHRVPAQDGAKAAATAYGAAVGAAGRFDLVLLGLGEDGHTASLFPGRPVGDEPDAAAALAVGGAPKPPAERVSLSARRLADARQVMFLVTGRAKTDAVRAWHRGGDIPAARIAPPGGVDVWLDAPAADGLCAGRR